MAFTDSSVPPAASHTGFPALCKVANDDGDKVGTQDPFMATHPSSSLPPSCASLIHCVLGRSLPFLPSSPSRNANPRSGSSLGIGGRLRYGTDPMSCSGSPQLSYDASVAADPSSLSRTVPHGSSSDEANTLGKDSILKEEDAFQSPHGTPSAPTAIRRSLSPTGAAAVVRKGMPAAPVLLRHSHGGKTRLLYADGHVETVVAGGARKAPSKRTHAPPAASHRRMCADDKRSHLRTLPLDAATREKAAPLPSPSADGRWLLESFNAVAQVHQQQLPPLVEPIATPPGAGAASSASPPSHAAERRAVCPVEPKSSWQTTKIPSWSFVTAESQPQNLLPRQQQVSTSFTPPYSSGKTPPRLPGNFSDGTGEADRAREAAEAAGAEGSSGHMAGFRTLMPTGPPPITPAALASRYDANDKSIPTAVASTVSVRPSCSTSNVGEVTFSTAADDATTVVAAMQRSIRAELAAQQRAGAQAFASRYARDVSASPSLFSLRFPVCPLSELHAFADRPHNEDAAAASWGARSTGESSAAFSERRETARTTSGVEEAPAISPTRSPPPPEQTPDVLLPYAQVTTPSGFTVPELLQDRLLPRETPTLQHKLSKLYAVRGLIDARDSTACRFTVSFMWFVLLRCRKARREQSLVNGYGRLSHAFSNAFPHVALDEALPPLDVLEQLLVELLTCLRYSVKVQSAANTATSAAVASSAASAARPSRHTEGLSTADGLATLTMASGREATPTPPPASTTNKTSDTPNAASAATAPSKVPLRLRLHEHGAHFPLLLSPTWSKLVSTGTVDTGSGDGYQESTYTQPQEQPHSPRRQEVQRMLPSEDALAILWKVYQDLWLHHSDYVQLCLYEELLQKQLTLQFGTLAVHLQQGAMSAEASTAGSTTPSFGAGVSQGLRPSVTWRLSAVPNTTPNARGEGCGDLRTSRNGAPASGAYLRPWRGRNTTAMMTNTAVAAAAAVAPAAMHGILESLLLLVAHATYYNCVFCFPNDVCAGMFDEEFRADVMRWLFACCHGVCLTHVQVRHWPMPAKGDYTDAQLKHRAATELEISALGLLPTCESQTTGLLHAAVVLGLQGKSSLTAIAEAARSASLVTAAEDGVFDVGDVEANSEARVIYQLDRYGRSAALHVAELERSMALLQRRPMAGDLCGSCNSQLGLRGVSGSSRTPGNSRGSSAGSASPAPSPFNVYPNRIEVVVTEASSRRSTARRQTGAKTLRQQKHSSAGGSPTTAVEPLSQFVAAVDARSNSGRGGLKHGASIQNGCGMQSPRQPRTSILVTAASPHSHREEEARAQYRTSTAVAVGKSLVTLAAELSRGSHKGSVARATWKTNSAQSTRQESEHRASASVRAFHGADANVSGSAAAVSCVAALEKRNSECSATRFRAHRRELSAGSLLSSNPLCVSPAPIRDYWLSMLLRAPFWWTTRTAMVTAATVAGAEVAMSPATLQQQSAQLVLWSSVPIGADGEAVPLQDLCRLQLEPWRVLLAVAAVPPISKEAQQAAHQMRVYGKTVPPQQARLYRMAERQKLHHQHSRQRRSQEHSRELSVLVAPHLTLAVTAAKTAATPSGLAPSAAGTTELEKPAVSVITQSFSGRWRKGSSVGGTADPLLMCSAMLPLTPFNIPEEAAALEASTTTAAVVATSAPAVAHPRRRGTGETDEGCTSSFSEVCSLSSIPASSHASSMPAHGKGGERIRWRAQQYRMHRSSPGSSNGCPDSTGVTTLTTAATPMASNFWSMMPNGAFLPPALANIHRRTLTNPSLTPHNTAIVKSLSTCPGGAGTSSNGAASDTRGTANWQGDSVSTAHAPHTEPRLRSRRLAPLKKEALHRRMQLLADLDTISKRDQVVRQHYMVQHLQLSSAMTYTQSEAMMRRYRAQSRLALERLICSEVGDATAVRAVTERTKEFNF
ncbi:conserved hypothetical protein [Leishmania mexicana MHOM/GT/2001/U1103]|uniref:Uncharacterized protein n=1 Tax=Leishmania mexicana (strain MHOM/GT/2001/U1103) TaxID=929439 RepID=E9AMB7_LEIMU|nr:conserved hypothetical protein [Leishmania mexicana MHOM/GT/2001/U1103]CBZ24072.1 conserved hypothetical protein [Leishmania mexicana MHOM/GT/2001/U1103]